MIHNIDKALRVPKVYIGWDSREVAAYEVAESSVRLSAQGPVQITPVKLARLEQQQLMRRPRHWRPSGPKVEVSASPDPRATMEQVRRQCVMWDEISDAPMSTEFAISRFLTPVLAQGGIAIFLDPDIVCYGDMYYLKALAESRPDIALWCVKHDHRSGFTTKMDGQPQVFYPRKNWSSVMVFNCDHPSNQGLTLGMINGRAGRDLHAMCWLHDNEIGALDQAWNWLVGVTERPPEPKIAHYTLGGPWLPNWQGGEYDDEWLSARAVVRPGGLRRDQGAGEETV